jgi:hypothetical protein
MQCKRTQKEEKVGDNSVAWTKARWLIKVHGSKLNPWISTDHFKPVFFNVGENMEMQWLCEPC